MHKKPQSHRDNTPILGSEMSFKANKAKSALNIVLNTSEKTLRHLSIGDNNKSTMRNVEVPQLNLKNTPRNFKFNLAPQKEAKKNYIRNSDKTIKPPEKSPKPKDTPVRSLLPVRQQTSTLLRSGAGVPNSIVNAAHAIASNRVRSLTFDNLNNKSQLSVTSSQARVDNKSIAELERRLENLQTIFMNKLNVFKDREPGCLKNEYKFVAMLIGDEAKLVIKEDDAKCLPNFIPARSLEDLNKKISKFFTGCLLSFIDKLRAYQQDNRAINCEEIFKELKSEEKDFCAILKDWVVDMCDEADVTLLPETQIDDKQNQFKPLSERSVQTDIELIESLLKENDCKFFLGLEQYDSAQRKSEKDVEIENLKKQYETKIDETSKLLLIEQSISNSKDEQIKKLQETNESQLQQLKVEQQRIEAQTKQIVELSSKLQNESGLTFELKKTREEFQRMRDENNELLDMKSNFLKKLHQRSTRIDLLERESKQQKLKMDLQNKELADLRQRFEEKIKECYESKESLDTRNQLIEHLRNAVEIEQRKRKEYEAVLNKPKEILVSTDVAETPPAEPKHREKKSVPRRSKHKSVKGQHSLQIDEFKIIQEDNSTVPNVKGYNPFELNLLDNDSPPSSPEERTTRAMIERRERQRRSTRILKKV